MISSHLHDTLLQELLTRNMHNQRAIHVYYKSIHKRYNRIIGSQKDIDPGGSSNLTKTIHLETQTISHKQISKLFTLQILNGQVLEHQSLPIKSQPSSKQPPQQKQQTQQHEHTHNKLNTSNSFLKKYLKKTRDFRIGRRSPLHLKTLTFQPSKQKATKHTQSQKRLNSQANLPLITPQHHLYFLRA